MLNTYPKEYPGAADGVGNKYGQFTPFGFKRSLLLRARTVQFRLVNQRDTQISRDKPEKEGGGKTVPLLFFVPAGTRYAAAGVSDPVSHILCDL